MEQSFMYKYSVLMAIPSARRGERVNIGAVVFHADGLDIRIPGSNKIGCLSAGSWDTYVALAISRLRAAFHRGDEAAEFIGRISASEPVIKMSALAWFLADTDEQYEAQISGILSDLVLRPRDEDVDNQDQTIRKSKINAEIAATFKKANILARRDEIIDDHKIKRDHYVSVSENLKADFAAKNGVYHITSTLDLRRETVHIKEAGWKTIVLVEAKRNLGADTKCFGVYAAAYDASQFASHIGLLKTYANSGVYNWLNPDDQWAYRQAMIAAIQQSGPPGGILGS
jgi:hypothetical protein